MNICGIELKSNNAILSVIQVNTEIQKSTFLNTKIKKIILEDEENKNSLLKFQDEIDNYLHENNISKIALKKRAKKGNFAGGAVTFKSETIIQLNTVCEVTFVTSQAIGKYTKNNEVLFPSELNKYQEQAYLSSLLLV
ncbi:DUF3010 family protein [Arcobacter sp. 15-2]|uniref:DUF3010 family protein n=1 Tax=Arcobacter sp. 15-2 TaxID=3374109 RepID=UPI00399CB8B8